MHDEDDFLRKLLENPADDTIRLVYADWLDERGDEESRAKSRFLRLTVRLLEPKRPKGDNEELQRLAAALPTDWLAVVSRLKVEMCEARRAEARRPPTRIPMNVQTRVSGTALFKYVCDRRWDEMTATDDETVRHCEKCRESVHYCGTIVEAREHAEQGHCVAVDLGIIRRPDDLSPRRMWLGRPSAETLRKEEERCRPDPVSAERERRKREQNCGEE